jgi:hypothetical protein
VEIISSEMEGGAKRARACYVASSITSESDYGDLLTLLASGTADGFCRNFL